LASKHSKKDTGDRRGIGLYTYEQARNTTPFQYFAQIVVGIIFVLVGGLLVYHVPTLRREEIRKFGSAEAHVWDWITSLAVVAIGVFMAHAGVIFYARRMSKRIFPSTHRSTPGTAHRD
jgi:hypothetical protein